MGKRSRRRRRRNKQKKQRQQKDNTMQKPHSVVRRTGFVVPPKPATEFKRPRDETFTVSGVTGFPEVYIQAQAHGKMLALVRECPIEISWMCSVMRDDDGDFVIKDVHVPFQSCGPATTNIAKDGDEKMMMELLEAGRASEVNELRCWGHSHVNMAVFASGTDEGQTQDFIDNLANAGSDHFVRFIGNKRGELLCHVYLLDQGIVLNNPPMHVRKDDVDYSDWAKDQIAEKVSRIATVPYRGAGGVGYYGGGSGGGRDYNPASSTGGNMDDWVAGGWWYGDQFIEDDLGVNSTTSSALMDDVAEAEALQALNNDEFSVDNDPEFDTVDEFLAHYDEFTRLPSQDDEDLDDTYDFATRGQ